jgi:hypothetical protein
MRDLKAIIRVLDTAFDPWQPIPDYLRHDCEQAERALLRLLVRDVSSSEWVRDRILEPARRSVRELARADLDPDSCHLP